MRLYNNIKWLLLFQSVVCNISPMVATCMSSAFGRVNQGDDYDPAKYI